MSDPLEVIDLTRPHGFLVWRGKQQAIASPTPLPVGEVMITSDGEAFGVATLGQPSQMALSEFEREEQKHCIRPEERQLLWPKASTFYVHSIKSWRGFNEPQPIADDYEPTDEEAGLIEKSRRLPKTIIIDPEAVSLTEGGFKVREEARGNELTVLLEATFGSSNLTESEGDKALPLYSLALVRRPTLRYVKKKEVTMPYEINEEECVINSDTGEVEKCHDSHEEAVAHMAALNINVEEKAVTKTEDGSEFSRSAYLYTSNGPSTWKLRIEAEPGQVTKAQLGAAAAALSSGGFRGQQVSLSSEEKRAAAKKLIGEYRKLDIEDDDIPDHLWATANMKPAEKAGRRMAGGMMDKLRTAMQMIQELMMWGEYHEEEPEEEMMMDMLKGNSGVAVKMVGGEPWHLSWSSNAFEDRDGEIFSLKSLEQYVRENEENEVKGWFNLWHIPHTDFAEKRYQAIIGKFLFEAGPYLKDEKGQKALKFFKEHSAGHPEIAPEGWGSSVEYKYLPEERKEKVYNWTWITRTSTLARGAAANVWTKAMQKESIMTDEQRKAAVAIFGEEFTNQLVGTGERSTKELEEAGVANKQAAPEGEAAPETPPVEVPAEVPATPDTTQLVTDLAAQMMTNVNEALTPVLTQFQQQIQGLGEQVKTLGEELKALKGEQALKEKVELPRFTFDLIRASQAKSTIVPEGDALKDKKPAEVAPVSNGGSVVQNYFPSAKG